MQSPIDTYSFHPFKIVNTSIKSNLTCLDIRVVATQVQCCLSKTKVNTFSTKLWLMLEDSLVLRMYSWGQEVSRTPRLIMLDVLRVN